MSGDTFEMTMLFDFFGDLLTEKQREYFDLYYNEDLSLSEISENVGITRQGVRDIIMRAEKTLVETEAKTGIVRRFVETLADIDRARGIASEIASSAGSDRVRELAEQLSEILAGMKG